MRDLTAPRREEYRRRSQPVAHRRRRLWVRLLKPLASALVLVGAPVAIVCWIALSPRFELRRFDVTGVQRVDVAWVRTALEPLGGRHLLSVRHGEVERRLARHPWILGVGLRKLPPDRLEVEVLERLPAAVVEVGEERHFVDGHGRTIAPYDPRLHSAPLVVVEQPADLAEIARAVELAERWRAADPAWAGGLQRLKSAGDASFIASAEALAYPLLVRSSNLENSLARFTRFLPQLSRRYPRLDRVDLRFDSQIVIHPAAPSRGREG